MANIHFERKACSDELSATLFFATGVAPTKEKFETHVSLKALDFDVKIVGFKNITVNGKKQKSLTQARYEIQRIIME
jgi:hypothetical protein